MERKVIVVVLSAVALCLQLGSARAHANQIPATVSPGELSDFARVLGPCPTFSWGDVDGSLGYELAVYPADEGHEDDRPLLTRELPGSVESYTPALAQCPKHGRRYAWSVRAIGPAGAGEWSPPRLFEVGRADSGGRVSDESITPAEEALLTAEEAPALGAPGVDVVLRRPTPPAGGGGMDVEGTVTADFFFGNGVGLTNVVAGGVVCTSCVGSTDIGSSAVGSSEIATGAVGSSEIAAGAVRGSELPTLRIVSVECEGGCGDNTLTELCNYNTSGYEPVLVDCGDVDNDIEESCGGGGNNKCSDNTVYATSPLSNYCDDVSGWDANVYCISTN